MAGTQQQASCQHPCEEDAPCSLKTDVPDSPQSKVTRPLLLSQLCFGSWSSQKQFIHSLRLVWDWGGQGTHERLSKLLRLRVLISEMRGEGGTEFVGLGGLYLWGDSAQARIRGCHTGD